ncbi:ThrRS/AlaRS common domain-containing protein [Marasmius fiardii PR-910]|nr:ThrRS/AlaRS common domain-containing protein [Marasmius fiardii PR-910]
MVSTEYFRVISSTLSIPKDPNISIPVGILACQRDPLLRSIQTTVVTSTVYRPPLSSKKTKNSVSAPTLPSEPILQVVLHDTIIFPEGGGQPTDTGLITTNDGKQWTVLQVKRHGGDAVHYVHVQDRDTGRALEAFAAGTQLTASLADKDFDRRYDHMSLHTSQHLLSALLETKLNLPTLSWSLTTSPSPCYVELPRALTPEEILMIQNEANQLVREGRRVHVEVSELDRETEKPVDVLENGRTAGKALPEDYTGGVKRVVVIDGVDSNPCCGTHLPSTSNLQLFLLPQTENLSRANSNNTPDTTTTTSRLFFLCGPRLLAHLASFHGLLTTTSSILSCGTPLVPDRVSQIIQDRKRAEKRVNDLEIELAKAIADGILSETRDRDSSGSQGVFKKHIHRTDDGSPSGGLLSGIAIAVADQAPAGGTKYLVVLSSSPSSQTSVSITSVLVFGSEDGLVKTVGERLKTRLGVKGGGKGPRWSGKFVGVWREPKEGAVAEEILKEVQ